MDELIEKIMAAAGVNEEQAKGGAGSILRLAKEKLDSGDYARLTSMLPGLDSLVDEAPSGGGGGLIGALSGLTGGLGSLVALASAFSSLGMNPEKIGEFAPVILQFIQDKGGDDAQKLFEDIVSKK